jgi:hypothetical protein
MNCPMGWERARLSGFVWLGSRGRLLLLSTSDPCIRNIWVGCLPEQTLLNGVTSRKAPPIFRFCAPWFSGTSTVRVLHD